MNNHDLKKEVEELVNDFSEKRFQSIIGMFNELFLDHKEEMKRVVIENMDKKFNGNMEKLNIRMDEQDKILKSLDQRIQPFEKTKNWFQMAKTGAIWIAGFITPITIIIAAIMYIKQWIK